MKMKHFWMVKLPVWAPQDDAQGGDTPPADPPPADDTPAAPDLSWLPEEFNGENGPDIDGFKARFSELSEADAARAEASKDIPEDASGYAFDMPEDIDFGEIKLPEGFAVELKADDEAYAPLFKELGGFLHKHGIPKAATGDLMQTLARYEGAKMSRAYAAAEAEMATLGPKADGRIEAVSRALETKLPEDQAKALMAMTNSAAGVQALEKLLGPSALSVNADTTQTQEDPMQAALDARYGKAS